VRRTESFISYNEGMETFLSSLQQFTTHSKEWADTAGFEPALLYDAGETVSIAHFSQKG